MAGQRGVWLLIVPLLAGCATTDGLQDPLLQDLAEAAEEIPEEVKELVPTSFDLDATDCSSFAAVIVRDEATVQDTLPAGVKARDAARLVRLPAESGFGAFVITWSSCTANGTAVSLGNIAAYIEPPTAEVLDGDYEHFHILQQWATWPTYASWIEAWGLSVGEESPGLEVMADQRTDVPELAGPRVADPGPGAMRLTIPDGDAGLEATGGGTTGYALENRVMRFWSVTETHRMWFDVDPDRDGTSGALQCSYGEDAVYAGWTGESTCGEAPSIAMVLPSYDMTASAHVEPR